MPPKRARADSSGNDGPLTDALAQLAAARQDVADTLQHEAHLRERLERGDDELRAARHQIADMARLLVAKDAQLEELAARLRAEEERRLAAEREVARQQERREELLREREADLNALRDEVLEQRGRRRRRASEDSNEGSDRSESPDGHTCEYVGKGGARCSNPATAIYRGARGEARFCRAAKHAGTQRARDAAARVGYAGPFPAPVEHDKA
jgi:hypothetical protein